MIIIDCRMPFKDISEFVFNMCIKLGLDISDCVLDLDYKDFGISYTKWNRVRYGDVKL